MISAAPMSLSSWLIYVSVVLVSTLTPGPAVLLSISNSVAHGRRAAIFSSLGNISGLFLLSVAAIAGIGAVLQSASWVLGLLKTMGAAYLIYLGIRRWQLGGASVALSQPALELRTSRQFFIQGSLLALTNPKAILFFAALFPQFIAIEHPLLPQFVTLTGTLMSLSFVSLTSYALLANAAKGWLAGPQRIRLFNRVSGTAFVLLGLAMFRLEHAAG
jgi:threonine/homoserine/homoserine lactone efflux protein